MTIFIQRLILVYIVFAIPQALATRDVGNGGTVYSCPDGVYLVDTKEQEYLNYPGMLKLEFPHDIPPVTTYLIDVFYFIQKVDQQLANELAQAFPTLLAMIANSGPTYSWNLTPDVGSVPVPTGCELKNVFMFRDAHWMELNNELFNRMSELDQAGLYLHEIIYQRMFQITHLASAPLARKITAALLATNLSENFKADIIRYTLLREPLMTKGHLFIKEEQSSPGDTGILRLSPELKSMYSIWKSKYYGINRSGKPVKQNDLISLDDLDPNQPIRVTFEISPTSEFASEAHFRAQTDLFRWNIVNYKNRSALEYSSPTRYLNLVKKHLGDKNVSNSTYELYKLNSDLNPIFPYYKKINESILAGEIIIAPANKAVESYLGLIKD